MLTMAITLAVVSFILEMILALKIRFLRKHASKSLLVNMACSLVLAWFISQVMFGAAGLIAMLGGLMAVILSLIGYRIISVCEWFLLKVRKVRRV